jgi:hypothetical protein
LQNKPKSKFKTACSLARASGFEPSSFFVSFECVCAHNERILENLKVNFPETYAKLIQEGAV